MYGDPPAVNKISPQNPRSILEYQLDCKASLDGRDYDRFYAEHPDGSVTAIDNIHGKCLVEIFNNHSAARNGCYRNTPRSMCDSGRIAVAGCLEEGT